MSNPPQPRRIVVCDDDPAARRGVVRALSSGLPAPPLELLECSDGQQCLALLGSEEKRVDLVFLDLRMPGMDGMTTLETIGRLPVPPPVVVLTADSSLRSAIEAIRAGAIDYLTKPYDIEELRLVLERTLERSELRRENRWLRSEVERLSGGTALLGESPPMRALAEAIERVAQSEASVVVLGESGTGKELVARRIHELGTRRRRPFVTLNCAAIPETLVESELFGYRRGAFTGADRDREGRFQQADSGTLFLDEIGDMPLPAQAKLLRVLQEGTVEPLGAARPLRVDVRVLAATHRDLRARVRDGSFREDLLFRLRVVELELPPLRQRGSDVLLLAREFLRRHAAGKLSLSPQAETCLLAYPWPGNVRELANAIERAAIFASGNQIAADDLPAELRNPAAAGNATTSAAGPGTENLTSLKARVADEVERQALIAALERHRGNVSRAAADLGLHRQSLQQKLKRLTIDPARFRGHR
jgi:DNA-binding NtrC family response regulator